MRLLGGVKDMVSKPMKPSEAQRLVLEHLRDGWELGESGGLLTGGASLGREHEQLAAARARIGELEATIEQARMMLETGQRASAFRLLGVRSII